MLPSVTRSGVGRTVSQSELVSPMHTVFREIRYGSSVQAGGTASGTYLFTPGSAGAGPTMVGVATTNSAPGGFRLLASDYAVSGLTIKLKIRGAVITNAVAQTGVDFTFGLYPVATWGGASGASPHVATLGTVVSGSTALVSAPAAGGPTVVDSSTFTFPSDGYYVLGVVLSANTVTNGNTTTLCRLMMNHAVA